MAGEYAPSQKALHWLVAVMVVVQAGLGIWVAFAAPDDEAAAMRLYNAHDGTGAVILVLMLLRLAARLAGRAPRLPPGTPRWAARAAWLNHRALYLVLLAQPLIGWLNNGANGFGWSLYGFLTIPAPISQGEAAAAWPSAVHFWTALALAALVAAHLGGVVFHTFIRRDGLLRRMT